MNSAEIIERLKRNKLRVTPQRVAIFEAIYKLNNHPSAENIMSQLKDEHPYISLATVYKVLDFLAEKNLLKKVKTENGIMRYDPVLSPHHHLYCENSGHIADYEDRELDAIINEYFKNKKIENFQIRDIKLQISGTLKSK